MRRGALLLLLVGCDKLFDLDHISAGHVPGDGGMDAGDAAGADAIACTPVGHDEDNDTIDDACDACPTIPSAMLDTDGDGLFNACDRDESPTGSDQVVAYWTFGTDQRSEFTVTGSTGYSSLSNGYVILNGGASLMTTQPFVPTRIELHVAMSNLTDYTADLQIWVGVGPVCHFRGANCAMGMPTAAGCVQYSAGVGTTFPATPAGVRRYSLSRSAANQLTCDVAVGPATGTTALGAGAINANTVGVAVTSTGTTRLEALVIYGAK